MTRLNIVLEGSDHASLKRAAQKQGISMAEFVRRAIQSALPAPGHPPWMRYAGMVETGDPRSTDLIDEIVYGSDP